MYVKNLMKNQQVLLKCKMTMCMPAGEGKIDSPTRDKKNNKKICGLLHIM